MNGWTIFRILLGLALIAGGLTLITAGWLVTGAILTVLGIICLFPQSAELFTWVAIFWD